jgi:hypothetical protein
MFSFVDMKVFCSHVRAEVVTFLHVEAFGSRNKGGALLGVRLSKGRSVFSKSIFLVWFKDPIIVRYIVPSGA